MTAGSKSPSPVRLRLSAANAADHLDAMLGGDEDGRGFANAVSGLARMAGKNRRDVELAIWTGANKGVAYKPVFDALRKIGVPIATDAQMEAAIGLGEKEDGTCQTT